MQRIFPDSFLLLILMMLRRMGVMVTPFAPRLAQHPFDLPLGGRVC